VPIFIRAGKALPVRATEVRLLLRHTPRPAFRPDPAQVEATQIGCASTRTRGCGCS
jgi:glucose-6-phosphate 1-dehydrogenase